MAPAIAFLPWPLPTFLGLALNAPPARDAPPPSKRYAVGPVLTSPVDHAALVASALWKVAFAAFIFHKCPLLDDATALDPTAIARVAVRDVLLTWAVGGIWDFLHLHPASPLYTALAPLKFTGVPPRKGQIPHDALWATISALVATGWEVAIAVAIAAGVFPRPIALKSPWWTHAPTLLSLALLPYVQIVHFYVTHRLQHRWFPPRVARVGWRRYIPDVGAFLYRHVHSLHHMSRDPTAFSGISMHPVESALFFTTMPLYAAFGVHPIVVLHAKCYNIVVAMLGHESYGDPSTGGHEHWLHHQLVDCNYGGNFVPLDWLFGTHVRDEDDFSSRWGVESSVKGGSVKGSGVKGD